MACVRRGKNGLTEKKEPGRSPIYRERLIFKLFDIGMSISFQTRGNNFLSMQMKIFFLDNEIEEN